VYFLLRNGKSYNLTGIANLECLCSLCYTLDNFDTDSQTARHKDRLIISTF